MWSKLDIRRRGFSPSSSCNVADVTSVAPLLRNCSTPPADSTDQYIRKNGRHESRGRSSSAESCLLQFPLTAIVQPRPTAKNVKFEKLLRTLTLKRAQKILKWRWLCHWRRNSYEYRTSCDVTSHFNVDFLAIKWSNRWAVYEFSHYFLSSFKVVPAMHTSHIYDKTEKPLQNLKVWEIITFAKQSLQLFFTSLDL